MDQSVINNVASHYAHEYGLTDHLDKLKEVIKNHGGDPFHIFRYMSFVKNFLIVSKNGMFTIEVSSPSEYQFLEDLKKKCYIQVKKIRVVEEPLNSAYLNKIYFTVTVFR